MAGGDDVDHNDADAALQVGGALPREAGPGAGPVLVRGADESDDVDNAVTAFQVEDRHFQIGWVEGRYAEVGGSGVVRWGARAEDVIRLRQVRLSTRTEVQLDLGEVTFRQPPVQVVADRVGPSRKERLPGPRRTQRGVEVIEQRH